MKSSRIIMCLFWICLVPGMELIALHNQTGAHDPTGIQICDNTYWIFTTGNGIYSMYSRDLISWTAGRTPFSRDVYPSWIKDYVPGFEGHFWAPECIYMNGKYHLYYSCSTWGSKTSCIGLVSNETLNPADPNFLWVDEGVVVYSNSSSEANCIDPSVFQDQEGTYYMSYGSYFGGIRIVELDSLSGKPGGSYRYPVASGNCEASYVIPHDNYYYLFINRGSCCQGVNSTYHIQVGRSASPTGPFLDKGGQDLNAGGGSTILSTNGSFIGPGHVGYFVESGEEWVSYHYYDGDRNGAPTLAIGTMKWEEEGWPVITNNFMEEGDYILQNHNSQLVFQTGDPVETGNPVTQGTYAGLRHQIWHLTPVGNGYYSIHARDSELVIETEACSSTSGSRLNMGVDNFNPCEHWKLERTSLLEYVISSRAGNHVINVPHPSFEEGTQLETAIYSGIASHYWSVLDSLELSGIRYGHDGSSGSMRIYPNPFTDGQLSIHLDKDGGEAVQLEIISLDGRCFHRESFDPGAEMVIHPLLTQGIYTLHVFTETDNYTEKLLVQ